jgi:hypothetical protein
MSYDWDASTDPNAQMYKAAERAASDAFFNVVLTRFGVTREDGGVCACLSSRGTETMNRYYSAGPCGNIPAEPARHAAYRLSR